MSQALPVTLAEFGREINAIWRSLKRPSLPRMALAVSGGVDSMALAHLWSQFINSDDPLAKEQIPKAFVVDHVARPESAAEAARVAGELWTRLGIDAEILTLKWPEGVMPSRLGSFETLARRLRYQALGKACRDQRLGGFLLGHHQDDVHETTLARLAKGHGWRGLMGMRATRSIPDCEGRWGISEGGHYQTESRRISDPVQGFESAGIQIARPLLNFAKDRLVATCIEEGVGWVEDESNSRVTLTMRNAIRAMIKTEQLPQALGRASMLHMVEENQAKEAQYEEMVETYYDALAIDIYDLHAGSLLATFPRPEDVFEDFTSWPVARQDALMARVLHRLVDLVAPEQYRDLEKLLPVVKRILEPRNWSANANIHRFQLAHTLFTRWPDLPHEDRPGPPTQRWLLHRAVGTLTLRESSVITIPPAPQHQRTFRVTFWRQWDRRYWFKFVNRTQETLYVGPAPGPALVAFMKSLGPFDRARMEFMRRVLIPQTARSTLLTVRRALPESSSGPSEDWAGEIVALPTLGIYHPDWPQLREAFDIRFKHIPLMRGVRTVPLFALGSLELFRKERLQLRQLIGEMFVYVKPPGANNDEENIRPRYRSPDSSAGGLSAHRWRRAEQWSQRRRRLEEAATS